MSTLVLYFKMVHNTNMIQLSPEGRMMLVILTTNQLPELHPPLGGNRSGGSFSLLINPTHKG